MRVDSLKLQVEAHALTLVCANAPNTSSEYSAFLEALGGVLEGTPLGDYHSARGL